MTNYVFNGDCRDLISDLDFDAVITDPPYCSGARRDADKAMRHKNASMLRGLNDPEWFDSDAMTAWGFDWFIRGVFRDIFKRLPTGSHCYVFTDWRQTPNLYGMLESVGFRVNHCLVWDKIHFGMGNCWRNQHENIVFASKGVPAAPLVRSSGTVIQCKQVSRSKRSHPTEKPVGLIQALMKVAPFKCVLDPFAGTGSVCVAAKHLGKSSVAVEINADYCDIARERIQQTEIL